MRLKETVLFLNPPGRVTYLRDYFCSKVSQADYINQPIDFLFLSAYLKSAFELDLIDAIVEELRPSACLKRIEDLCPTTIVGLIGSASLSEDMSFYWELSRRVSASLVLIGDVLIDRREERLRLMPFVDAFLHDFSTPDLLNYLRAAGRTSDRLKNMTIRSEGGVLALPIERSQGGSLDFPIPEHRLFLGKNYRHPFVRSREFATVMTDFGCPYSCTFCVMSTLGWSHRPIQRVLEELEALHSLGVQELLLLDQTFGVPRARSLHWLDSVRALPYSFGWVCFSRPDVLDQALVRQMKQAGCHTIILGLESGNESILESVRKGYSRAQVQAGFELCRKEGIQTVATILLGLPEETEATFLETMTFLKRVSPDFASFNVAVPRMGTPFRNRVRELGLITDDFEEMDQSGSQIAMPGLQLTRSQIAAMRKRAVRDFYFSSGYLATRLRRVLAAPNPLTVLRTQVSQGASMLTKFLRSS